MDRNNIYSVATFSVLALASSVFYQIGYFGQIGIEFISFIDSSDVIISAAFTAPILSAMYFISIFIDGKMHCNDTETNFMYRIMFPSRSLRNYIGNNAPYAVIFMLVVLFFIRIYYELDYAAGLFFVMFNIFVFMYWASSIDYDIAVQEYAELTNIRAACFFALNLSYVGGGFYAEYHAGRECRIDNGDNIKLVIFYRSVNEGIIVKYNNDVKFINHSNVKSIRCTLIDRKMHKQNDVVL